MANALIDNTADIINEEITTVVIPIFLFLFLNIFKLYLDEHHLACGCNIAHCVTKTYFWGPNFQLKLNPL